MLYLHGVLPQRSPSSDFGENQLSRGLISLSLLLSSHLKIFQHLRVRSFTWCYPGFNLLKSRSPPLRVYCPRLVAHFALGFPSPPLQSNLGWPRTITRRLIMQKAGRHHVHLTAAQMASVQSSLFPVQCISRDRNSFKPRTSIFELASHSAEAKWTWLRHIVCNRLQVLFHSPNRGSFRLSLAVLVHYRLPRSI